MWVSAIYRSVMRKFFWTRKKPRNITFLRPSRRGADRIWTGGYWCCRPLPYHLATAPYLIKMTPTGIEPVLPPWKGDVLTAWPWSRVLSPLGVSNVSDKKTPRVGLEPTTTRLTAECSTIELSRKISCFISDLRECSAFSKSYKAKCEEIIYSFKTEHWNLILIS